MEQKRGRGGEEEEGGMGEGSREFANYRSCFSGRELGFLGHG